MTGAPRRLVLLRHGVTAHNAAGLWQGHLDIALTDEGVAQAHAAAPTLARYGFARVVSSDLARAAETARIVGDAAGLVPSYDPRLREIHVGAWQGQDAAAVEAAFPGQLARLAEGEDLVRGGDGECVADLVRRARPAVDELVASLAPGESALVVTHGISARSLAADLAGIDQRTAWLSLTGLGNCHWAELVEGPRRWRIALWNGRAGDLGAPHREGHGY